LWCENRDFMLSLITHWCPDLSSLAYPLLFRSGHHPAINLGIDDVPSKITACAPARAWRSQEPKGSCAENNPSCRTTAERPTPHARHRRLFHRRSGGGFFGFPTYRLPNPEPCQIAIKKPCHLSIKVTKNRSIFLAKLRCRTDTLFYSLARANGDGGFGATRAVGASFERVR